MQNNTTTKPLKQNKMEIIAIIGAVSLAVCLSGTIALVIMGSDTPKSIKIFTWVSMFPLVVCFSVMVAFTKQSEECKVKYRKVNVELYEKVN